MMAMAHWQLSDCLLHDRHLCYGHLSNKEESLFEHAPKTVKDASQQGEQGRVSTSISFIQWLLMFSLCGVNCHR